jgi:hypothetical protein
MGIEATPAARQTHARSPRPILSGREPLISIEAGDRPFLNRPPQRVESNTGGIVKT